jgi:hypothetical protein
MMFLQASIPPQPRRTSLQEPPFLFDSCKTTYQETNCTKTEKQPS